MEQKNKDVNKWDKLRREDSRFSTPENEKKPHQGQDFENRDFDFEAEENPKDLTGMDNVKYQDFHKHRRNYPDLVVEREYKRPRKRA